MDKAGGTPEAVGPSVSDSVRAEVRRRAGKGAFVYPLIAAVIVGFTPLWHHQRDISLGFVAGLSVLAALRKLAARPAERRGAFGSDRQLAFVIALQALVWGSFTALIFLWYDLTSITWLALVASAGFAAGGTAALGIHPGAHRPFVAGLALPIVLTPIFVGHEAWPVLLVVASVFVWFLLRDARQHAESFEDLIRTQHALRVARDQAREADRAKSAFLAMMSHEIRTPMHAVVSTASMLLETELDARQRRYTTTLAHSGESLVELINDILDFSRIEAHGLELEQTSFELESAFEEVTQMLEPLARKANLAFSSELDLAAPLWVKSDRRRFQQVFINLLGNAIKFTERGQVCLEASARVEDDRVQLRVRVIDTGIGIDQEQLRRIFDPFEQAEKGTRRKFGGSGLGLAICRLLVEGMGGSISVQSELGKGTAFLLVFDLPQGQEEEEDMPAVPASAPAPAALPSLPSGTCVLVVDDSELNRELAAEMLGQLGCDVVLADRGEAAIARFKERTFQIVLMDCQMGGMDGYETTRQLRQLGEQGASVPILAVTANAFDEDRRRALDSGMNDLLAKPFGLRDLEVVLKQWLGLDGADAPPRPVPGSGRPSLPSLYPHAARHVATLLRIEPSAQRVDRIVGAFLSQWPQRLAMLERGLAARDCEEIREVMHTLAGAIPFLGIGALDEEVRRLHELARAGDLFGFERSLPKLTGMVSELSASRARHRGRVQVI